MAMATVRSQAMRQEQLKRYIGSQLDLTPSTPRDKNKARFKFNKECVFLAACSFGDMEEMETLLNAGIDINTANVDGLTALHQACIYQRLDMVKFLVEHSADVNVHDNDGYTPLHVACSNDCIDIARYLINNGSKLDIVDFDGDLPIDVTENDEMNQLLLEAMENNGIDADSARRQEEEKMVEDANYWLDNKINVSLVTHPKSGASPLHVAAARGYVDVMRILLQAGVNINAQDRDGWTPIHGAAHWGQRDACKLLVENLCDLNIRDSYGLLAQDVADPKLGNMIEELQQKQSMLRIQSTRRRSYMGKRRSSVNRLSIDQKQTMLQRSKDEERAALERAALVKRTGISESSEPSMTVFGVEEEKEEEMEEYEGQAPDRNDTAETYVKQKDKMSEEKIAEEDSEHRPNDYVVKHLHSDQDDAKKEMFVNKKDDASEENVSVQEDATIKVDLSGEKDANVQKMEDMQEQNEDGKTSLNENQEAPVTKKKKVPTATLR